MNQHKAQISGICGKVLPYFQWIGIIAIIMLIAHKKYDFAFFKSEAYILLALVYFSLLTLCGFLYVYNSEVFVLHGVTYNRRVNKGACKTWEVFFLATFIILVVSGIFHFIR